MFSAAEDMDRYFCLRGFVNDLWQIAVYSLQIKRYKYTKTIKAGAAQNLPWGIIPGTDNGKSLF